MCLEIRSIQFNSIQFITVEKLQKSPTNHPCNALTSALRYAEVNNIFREIHQSIYKSLLQKLPKFDNLEKIGYQLQNQNIFLISIYNLNHQ